MKRRPLRNPYINAAIAGILAGGSTLSHRAAAAPDPLPFPRSTEAKNGCSGKDGCGAQPAAEKTAGKKAADTHACKGLNSCKGKGGCSAGDNGCAGKNSCKGKGGCASAAAKHSCKGQNSCKGLGGCSTGDNGCAGKNSCKGKGGCAVPMKAA